MTIEAPAWVYLVPVWITAIIAAAYLVGKWLDRREPKP